MDLWCLFYRCVFMWQSSKEMRGRLKQRMHGGTKRWGGNEMTLYDHRIPRDILSFRKISLIILYRVGWNRLETAKSVGRILKQSMCEANTIGWQRQIVKIKGKKRQNFSLQTSNWDLHDYLWSYWPQLLDAIIVGSERTTEVGLVHSGSFAAKGLDPKVFRLVKQKRWENWII